MSTGKHYFIEQDDEGFFTIRAQDSDRASGIFSTQAEAVAEARCLNPEDHPDVERVLNTDFGSRNKWRAA